jgi:hypothetical protein
MQAGPCRWRWTTALTRRRSRRWRHPYGSYAASGQSRRAPDGTIACSTMRRPTTCSIATVSDLMRRRSAPASSLRSHAGCLTTIWPSALRFCSARAATVPNLSRQGEVGAKRRVRDRQIISKDETASDEGEDPAGMRETYSQQVEHLAQRGGDVPAWLLDTDYNELSFHVSQAFFPRTGAWENLKRALRGVYDDTVWDHLAGAVSAPFQAGEHGQIAVKVIDDRGNELMVVKHLKG